MSIPSTPAPASIPAAPLYDQALKGVPGYAAATYSKVDDVTTVTLKKEEGSKVCWITLSFKKPIDEARLTSYLNQKETKEKIEQMVKIYFVFEPIYGAKKDFKITSFGERIDLHYTSLIKDAKKRLDLSEKEFQTTWHKKLENYKAKVEKAEKDQNGERHKKFKAKKDAFYKLFEKFHPLSKTLKLPAY